MAHPSSSAYEEQAPLTVAAARETEAMDTLVIRAAVPIKPEMELMNNIMTRITYKAPIAAHHLDDNGWLWVRCRTEAQARRLLPRLELQQVMGKTITLRFHAQYIIQHFRI